MQCWSLHNLPQLLLVGDQSSGKSSVLEELSKLVLPQESGICTIYATQIDLLWTEEIERKITAFLIIELNVGSERAPQLKAWAAENIQGLILDSLMIIVEVGRAITITT